MVKVGEVKLQRSDVHPAVRFPHRYDEDPDYRVPVSFFGAADLQQ